MLPKRTLALISAVGLIFLLLVAAGLLGLSYYDQGEHLISSLKASDGPHENVAESTFIPDHKTGISGVYESTRALPLKYKIAFGVMAAVIVLSLSALGVAAYFIFRPGQGNTILAFDEDAIEKAKEDGREEIRKGVEEQKEQARSISKRTRLYLPLVVFGLYILFYALYWKFGSTLYSSNKEMPKYKALGNKNEADFATFGFIFAIVLFIVSSIMSFAGVDSIALLMGISVSILMVMFPFIASPFKSTRQHIGGAVISLIFIAGVISLYLFVPLREY